MLRHAHRPFPSGDNLPIKKESPQETLSVAATWGLEPHIGTQPLYSHALRRINTTMPRSG